MSNSSLSRKRLWHESQIGDSTSNESFDAHHRLSFSLRKSALPQCLQTLEKHLKETVFATGAVSALLAAYSHRLHPSWMHGSYGDGQQHAGSIIRANDFSPLL
jgi:hypothetical protein